MGEGPIPEDADNKVSEIIDKQDLHASEMCLHCVPEEISSTGDPKEGREK